ncbi:phage portal protein [Paracoccus sp. S-4012]|uniref:phage portal protein n=1 Tax=Paracoccus sp. S-4012 TaxID=2665648 RepID=UPI0012B02C01|nr:phage portal protein [Paracoccus sp. S-4012]MRX52297.1 phage portal protein [Paracoccus sp. S-4012]
MRWIERLGGRTPATETKALNLGDPLLMQLFGIAPSGTGTAISAAAAMKVPAIRRAVSLIAESVRMPFKVYAAADNQALTDRPAYGLIHAPANPWTDAPSLREALTADALLGGAGFALVVRNSAGQPLELHRLDPGTVTVETAADGEPAYRVRYEVGGDRLHPFGDVLHLQSFAGVSPITLAREAIALSLAAESHLSGFFRNGGRPPGVIRHPAKLDAEGARKIAASWFTTHSGEQSGKTAVLDEGMEFHALDKVRREADRMAEEGYFESASVQHHKHWHDFAENNLYGIEISEGIARTAKMNMIIHDDGHTNVIAFDGLEPIDTMRERTNNHGFKANRFDYIITNPPFGAKVKLSEKRYLEDYDLGSKDIDWIDAKLKNVTVKQKKVGEKDFIRRTFLEKARDQQTTEVLFIEQCHRFLKPGGYMAMVIPDSILTNSSIQYVRDWIEEHWRIVSVVSLPQFAFATNGAGMKSSVLFLRKHDEATTIAIQRAKEKAQDDIHARKDGGKALEKLIKEKAAKLKKGDATIQQIDQELVARLDALDAQGNLTPEARRKLKFEADKAKKAHEETEAYQQWKAATSEEYNERIATLRETLNDEFLAKVKSEVADYEIFMAIADDIGYDATGRATGGNELDTVAAELSRFIHHIEGGAARPFA